MFFIVLLSTVGLGRAAPEVGEIYVLSDAGALVFLDDQPTTRVAPVLLEGVPVGPHTVRADQGCRTASGAVTVVAGAVARVELKLGDGTGDLAIVTDPPGAEVWVDGDAVGPAPIGPIPVPCGVHQVRSSMVGRQDATGTAVVDLGATVKLSVRLVPIDVGSLAVVVKPLDARVSVDGRSKGEGPMTIEGLVPGEHQLSARARGYGTLSQQVDIQGGHVTRVDLILPARSTLPPLSQRQGPGGYSMGRVALNTGVTLVTAGLAVVSLVERRAARQGYVDYAELTWADDPDAFYADRVQGPQRLGVALGVAAGVGLGASGLLWSTGRAQTVSVRGRF